MADLTLPGPVPAEIPPRLVAGNGHKHNGPFGEFNLAERAMASALGQLVAALGRTLYHPDPPYCSGLSGPAAMLRRGVWFCNAGRRGRFA